MATENTPNNTPKQASDEQQENQNNRSNVSNQADNRSDESISTAGDTSLGKGSKTGLSKDEKEASDNYDTDRN